MLPSPMVRKACARNDVEDEMAVEKPVARSVGHQVIAIVVLGSMNSVTTASCRSGGYAVRSRAATRK